MKNSSSPHRQAGSRRTAKPQRWYCQEFVSHSSLPVVATRPHGLLQSICILLGLFMHQGTKEQATSSHWALISHFKWAILTFMVEQLPGRRGGRRQAGLGWQDRAASEDADSVPLPGTQRNPYQGRATPFPPAPTSGAPRALQPPWWCSAQVLSGLTSHPQ